MTAVHAFPELNGGALLRDERQAPKQRQANSLLGASPSGLARTVFVLDTEAVQLHQQLIAIDQPLIVRAAVVAAQPPGGLDTTGLLTSTSVAQINGWARTPAKLPRAAQTRARRRDELSITRETIADNRALGRGRA